MGIRIQQLPPLIANQIAAGEVIERPASVVKELLENSLDSGANSISIELAYGGLNQIKISDNGSGIYAEDLPLAIAAHATSKIRSLNDLYAIDSMGFRGEALASIASVAKLSISSKPADQDRAMMLRVKGTESSLEPCARSEGTTIDVVDLFFNAPVRKRFLKGEKLEFQAIEAVVKRFALSAPGMAITLKHNGKQVLSLPAANNEQAQITRLTRLLGSVFMKDAIFLDVTRADMRLYGWISGPKFQRSQNDRQWVYLNQRMVKDKLLHHAIKQAYDGLLHPGRFPACVLYFSMNHGEVDVNVHPTKHEVRFQQPRLVHDFFTSQLTAALQAKEEPQYQPEVYAPRESVSEVCEPYPQLASLSPRITFAETEVPWTLLHTNYILTFIEQQPYVVSLLALHQRALQEQLASVDLPLARRPLLVPVRYAFDKYSPELGQNLEQLGIQSECIDGGELLIRSIPIALPYLDLPLFLSFVAELEQFELTNLLDLMIQAQVFDPRLLSGEEKMALHHLLVNSVQENIGSLYKKLTPEDCQNLVSESL